MTSRPNPTHAPADNVTCMESWLQRLNCPRCNGHAISQVDQLEFAYPVQGVNRSRNVIHLDLAESRTEIAPTADPFFRCHGCRNEWPVDPETEFVERQGP